MKQKNIAERTFDWISKLVKRSPQKPKSPFPSAVSDIYDYGRFNNRVNVNVYSFNGERNVGGAGPMNVYENDYVGMRIRSWQAMFESDMAIIAINRLVEKTIGKGLKPQVQPIYSVLEDYGIKLDKTKFSKTVEDRFNLFLNSRNGDFSNVHTINRLSAIAEKNALVGGDVLTILRYKNGQISVQLIDGQHVQSPYYGSEWWPRELPNGHRLIDGVEIDEKGKHIAYYVKKYRITGDMNDIFDYTFERVEVIGKGSGLTYAYLYYGNEHRIDNVRGVPILTACIEKLKRMEEYSDAILEQAKEAAKVNYQQVHELNAEGKASWSSNGASALDIGGNSPARLPTTDDGYQLDNTVNVTTIGTAYNNPPGSEIKMLTNENPTYFKDFTEINSNIFFAVIGIPPNVAMMLYNDSYSASRASIMDWIQCLELKRDHHKTGWLQNIYNFWFRIQVYENKIQAPGYILAVSKNENTILEAYSGMRVVGENPGHIDPKAEVQAIREALGPLFANAPLIDLESATERLGFGNSDENLIQAAKEKETLDTLGLKVINNEENIGSK